MSARFLELEVFTDTPGHGNPAGVVIADEPVTDAAQRAWSERVRKPGNGFLWPAAGNSWNARFHTPGREVGISGHTALASGHAAMLPGATRITLRSRTDALELAREDGALWLTLPRPKLDPFDAPLARIARALGHEADGIDHEVGCVRTADGDLLLPLAPEVDPLALKPDFDALAPIGNELGTRGFCVFTRRTIEETSHWQSRFFGPHLGLPEDIATGSTQASLAKRLWDLGRIRVDRPVLRLVAEQGDALGRPCRLRVEMITDDGALIKVRVGGQVVTVSERQLAPGEI